MSYLYLAVAILCEVVATTALKASYGFTRVGPTAIAFAGYGVALLCLSLTLEHIPIGIAYAIWAGVGSALIVVMAYLLYGQHLDSHAYIGIALIVLGAVFLNVSSSGGR